MPRHGEWETVSGGDSVMTRIREIVAHRTNGFKLSPWLYGRPLVPAGSSSWRLLYRSRGTTHRLGWRPLPSTLFPDSGGGILAGVGVMSSCTAEPKATQTYCRCVLDNLEESMSFDEFKPLRIDDFLRVPEPMMARRSFQFRRPTSREVTLTPTWRRECEAQRCSDRLRVRRAQCAAWIRRARQPTAQRTTMNRPRKNNAHPPAPPPSPS